jgi:hypothetical protein
MRFKILFSRSFIVAGFIFFSRFCVIETRAQNAQTAPAPPPPTAAGLSVEPDLFDVSLGFTYLHVPDALARSMYGFDVSLFVNAKSWLALGGEFMAGWGRQTHTVFFQNVAFDESRMAYVFGPRIKVWQRDNFKVFGEALAGGAHAHVSTLVFGIHRSASADGFAAAIGGGAEWKFTRRFSWRVVEANYIPAYFNNQWEDEWRVSTGVTYSFGADW